MATRIKEPQVAFIERNTDIPSVIQSYFPEYEDGKLVPCPFHGDTKFSLSISSEGKAKCHGCTFVAGDIVDLVSKLEELDYDKTKLMMYRELVNGIPESTVEACAKILKRKKSAMKYLTTQRNISEETIERFRLGYEIASDRITIPIYDQFGTCVNIRRMRWKGKGEKALNTRGHGECRLFPENKAVMERRLLLVEGEWDCLVGRSFGLPAVTWTGGAGSWNEKHEYLFRDKAVGIIYDNDTAGYQGAFDALQILKDIALYAIALVPPRYEDAGINDLTDFSFVYPEDLHSIRRDLQAYKFPKKHKPKNLCPHCHQEMPK